MCPQFSLKTMLWLMAAVAAFFSGAVWQRSREEHGFYISGPQTHINQPTLGPITLPASQAPRSFLPKK